MSTCTGFLYDINDKKRKAWEIEIRGIAARQHLSDGATIALAILRCEGKAKEKARSIDRTLTGEAFITKLLQTHSDRTEAGMASYFRGGGREEFERVWLEQIDLVQTTRPPS